MRHVLRQGLRRLASTTRWNATVCHSLRTGLHNSERLHRARDLGAMAVEDRGEPGFGTAFPRKTTYGRIDLFCSSHLRFRRFDHFASPMFAVFAIATES